MMRNVTKQKLIIPSVDGGALVKATIHRPFLDHNEQFPDHDPTYHPITPTTRPFLDHSSAITRRP